MVPDLTTPPSAKVMTTGELAQAYQVSPRTLRWYEAKGLLQPQQVNGHRYFGQADRVRLEIILKGKRLGFTLAEIRRQIIARNGQASDLHDVVKLSRTQIEDQLAYLEGQRTRIEAAITELRAELTTKERGDEEVPR